MKEQAPVSGPDGEQWHPHVRAAFPINVSIAQWRGTLEWQEAHPVTQFGSADFRERYARRTTMAMQTLGRLSARSGDEAVFPVIDSVRLLLEEFLRELERSTDTGDAARITDMLADPLIDHLGHVVVEALPEQVFRDAAVLYEPNTRPREVDSPLNELLGTLAEHASELTEQMPERLPMFGPRTAGSIPGAMVLSDIQSVVRRMVFGLQ